MSLIVGNSIRYLKNLIELRDKFTDEAFFYFLKDFGTDSHDNERPGDDVNVHNFFQIGWGHSIIGFAAYNEIGGISIVPNDLYEYSDVRNRYVIKLDGEPLYEEEVIKHTFGTHFYDNVKPDPDKRNLTIKSYMDRMRTILDNIINELHFFLKDNYSFITEDNQQTPPPTAVIEFTGNMPVPVTREELQAIRDKVESQGDIWVAVGIEILNKKLREEVAKDILTSFSNCSVILTGADLRDALKATSVPPKVWIRITKVFNDAKYFASILKSMDGGVMISLRAPDSGGLTSR